MAPLNLWKKVFLTVFFCYLVHRLIKCLPIKQMLTLNQVNVNKSYGMINVFPLAVCSSVYF